MKQLNLFGWSEPARVKHRPSLSGEIIVDDYTRTAYAKNDVLCEQLAPYDSRQYFEIVDYDAALAELESRCQHRIIMKRYGTGPRRLSGFWYEQTT